MSRSIGCPVCGLKVHILVEPLDGEVMCHGCGARILLPSHTTDDLPEALEPIKEAQTVEDAVEPDPWTIQARPPARMDRPEDSERFAEPRLVLQPIQRGNADVRNPVKPASSWVKSVVVASIIIGLAGAVLIGAFVNPFRKRGERQRIPLVLEDEEDRRREIARAFKDALPVNEEEIGRETKTLFEAMRAAYQKRNVKELTALFNVERMVDEMEVQGLLPPALLRERKSFSFGVQIGIGQALMNEGNLFDWESFEIRKIKKLGHNEAVVIVRHNADDGSTTKLRWWVTRERGIWQVFDFEDLDVGLRMSTLAGSFVEALKADPGGTQRAMNSLRDAVQAGVMRQDIDTAEKKLREIEDFKFPERVEGLRYSVVGLVKMMRGQDGEALKDWDTAHKFNPDMPALDLLKGVALNRLGKWDAALKHIEAYQTLLGDDSNVCQQMGLALSGMGRFKDAAVSYRKSLDYDSKNADAFLGLIRSVAPGENRDDFAQRFAKLDRPRELYDTFAQDCKQANDFEGLEELAKAMVKIDPNYAPPLFHAAMIKATKLKPDQALPLFQLAMSKEKNRDQQQAYAREFMLAIARVGKAVETYEIMPDAGEAFKLLAGELQRDFRTEDLRRLIAAHEKKQPKDPLLPFYKGDMLARDGKYRQAEEAFAAGLTRPPEQSVLNQFRHTRVLTRYHTGQIDSAYEEIPPRQETFTQLASLCLQDQKFEPLQTLLDAHAKFNPGDPTLLTYRYRIKLHKKEVAETIALFRESLRGERDAKRREDLVASFLFAMVDSGHALKAYEAVPDGEMAFRFLARELLNFRKLDEMKQLMTMHEKRHPDDSNLLFYRGEQMIEDKAWDKAAATLLEASKKCRRDMLHQVGRRYEFAMFKLGKSVEAYAKVRSGEDSFINLFGLLASAKKGKEMDELVQAHRSVAKNPAQMLYYEARAKTLMKQYEKAADLVKQAVEKEANVQQKRFYVADWLHDMEDMGQGLEGYRAAPDRQAAFETLANSWVFKKKDKELATLLDEHAKRSPDDPQHTFYMGQLTYLRGEYQQAKKLFAEALARANQQNEFVRRQALYRARIKLGETVMVYREMGASTIAFQDLSQLCRAEKDGKELKALIEEHLKSDPENPAAPIWKHDVLWLNGEYEKVVQDLTNHRTGIYFEPRFSFQSEDRLILGLVKLKRHDEAIREAEAMHAKKKGNSVLLILAYAGSGDVKKTIEAMQRLRQDRFFVDDCYFHPELGPILMGDAFREFRERFPKSENTEPFFDD